MSRQHVVRARPGTSERAVVAALVTAAGLPEPPSWACESGPEFRVTPRGTLAGSSIQEAQPSAIAHSLTL